MAITHTFTTEQLKKLIKAYANGVTFPEMTDDPKINYAIDCIVDGDDEEYCEKEYLEEIKLMR